MRTVAEIKYQMEVGEKFIKEHPRSMFGDDNVKDFQIFKKIVEKAQKGETSDDLYAFIDDAYIDEEEHMFASDVVDWLFEDGDPIYT